MFLGQEDFDRFRPMVFPGTDIFIGIKSFQYNYNSIVINTLYMLYT